MSKQDIEKRLGFAAQGVKAEFAADKRTTAGALRKALKAKGITSAADLEWHGISAKDPDSTPYWLYEDGSMEKIKSSRLGVKAKMETPMRVALTPMHTRAEQGYENFISNLMKLGGITREQAQKAFKAFKDAKVLVTKEQYRGGGITVKHGAFMERDVIRRAAGLPEESSRTGVKAEMAAPANWESKLDAKNLADSFNVEGLRELLGSAKEIARKYPQYKALGQKMADGINMILSAVKQMKAESIKASRLGVKTAFAASDIIVKENAQYIYYYPEDDARATFPDDNGKGAYTVKSNRTGKPVSAKTYRSLQEAAAASNEMNEKLPPLKKAKSARPGVKAKFDTKVGSKGNKSAMIAKNGPDADASWLAWVVQHHGEGQGESVLGTMRSYSTEARAKAAALRGLETSGLRGSFSRPAAKAKA